MRRMQSEGKELTVGRASTLAVQALLPIDEAVSSLLRKCRNRLQETCTGA